MSQLRIEKIQELMKQPDYSAGAEGPKNRLCDCYPGRDYQRFEQRQGICQHHGQ